MYALLAISNGSACNLDLNGELLRSVHYLPQQGDGETVRETISLMVEGTPDEIRTWMIDAERVLQTAGEQARDSVGTAIYLLLQAKSGERVWRSRVLGGSLQRDPKWNGNGDRRLRGVLQMKIVFERQNFWEYRTPLTLVNWQTVHNGCRHSEGISNTLAVDGDTVGGTLPAPLTVELRNSCTHPAGNIWVGCDGRFDGGLTNQFEAEEMNGLGSGVSVIADDACSERKCLSVSAAGGSERCAGIFPLHATIMKTARNRPYRFLGVFKDVAAGVYGFVKLVYAGVALSVSPAVLLQDGVVDFGVFFLPPWFYDENTTFDPADAGLAFCYYRESGMATFKLDFLKALPVDGGCILFEDTGIGLEQGQTLKLERGHCITSLLTGIGGMYFQTHRPKGGGLYIHPGSDARLHLVWNQNGGACDARDAISLRVTCRPRVRSL